MTRSRGVSEVVGFILVFSLVTTTVGVVYVAGFDGLTNARDAERINNVERAFDVMAHNIEDIDRDGAPGRSTEIKLADGQISFSEETTVKWCWDNDPDTDYDNLCDPADTTTMHSETLQPVIFEAEGTQLVYENGAVIREQRGGAILVREPRMLFRDSTERSVIIPTIDLNAQGKSNVAGDTTMLVRTQLQAGQGARKWLDPSPVTSERKIRYTIQTTPNRAGAWERYLENRISWESNACEIVGSGNVKCDFTADQMLFRVVRIDVTFA
ncbi:DUF7289 family protein [Halomarina rubra]|uniref:Flagellin n=1 Tax=Halomarina rubra TaxID=2071873 RepID=A0ABD6ASJ0_9EURY|nr:hypothetical protein [Halomarina rubra]